MADPLEKIEQHLRAIVDECATCCGDAARAKLWTYVGIALEFQQPERSRAALDRAVSLDPNVDLDDELATDALRDALRRAK